MPPSQYDSVEVCGDVFLVLSKFNTDDGADGAGVHVVSRLQGLVVVGVLGWGCDLVYLSRNLAEHVVLVGIVTSRQTCRQLTPIRVIPSELLVQCLDEFCRWLGLHSRICLSLDLFPGSVDLRSAIRSDWLPVPMLRLTFQIRMLGGLQS